MAGIKIKQNIGFCQQTPPFSLLLCCTFNRSRMVSDIAWLSQQIRSIDDFDFWHDTANLVDILRL